MLLGREQHAMHNNLKPEDYRRIAREFRAIGSDARDPKQAADALQLAEDCERMALEADAKWRTLPQQLQDAGGAMKNKPT
jgi:hypothetical protein